LVVSAPVTSNNKTQRLFAANGLYLADLQTLTGQLKSGKTSQYFLAAKH